MRSLVALLHLVLFCSPIYAYEGQQIFVSGSVSDSSGLKFVTTDHRIVKGECLSVVLNFRNFSTRAQLAIQISKPYADAQSGDDQTVYKDFESSEKCADFLHNLELATPENPIRLKIRTAFGLEKN